MDTVPCSLSVGVVVDYADLVNYFTFEKWKNKNYISKKNLIDTFWKLRVLVVVDYTDGIVIDY